MSSNAALCAGCHGIIGGTSFVENGQAFHFGCRPSQQQHDFPTQSDIEHGDLLARIAALEAELQRQVERREAEKLRAVQAEARVTALDIQLRDADHENIGLKAEVGRLRCCGNCERMGARHFAPSHVWMAECKAGAHGEKLEGPMHKMCRLTPSRWAGREDRP